MKLNLFNSKKKNLKSENVELLREVYNEKIYGYGEHFKKSNKSKIKISVIKSIYITLGLFIGSKIFFHQKGKPNILCAGYFDVHRSFEKNGFNVFRPFWSSYDFKRWKYDIKLLYSYLKVKILIETSGVYDLEKSKSYDVLDLFKDRFSSWMVKNDIKGVILPGDKDFFSSICINQCKKLNIPIFIFNHGVPAFYNKNYDNSSDYIAVWSDKIKAQYINIGFEKQKILVTGHPKYSGKTKNNIKFILENILVCTKGLNKSPYYINDEIIISDRGNLLLYLEHIKNVLFKLGVKKVRLRNHPSENSEWYKKNIDNSFFEIDQLPLDESIKKSKLVIGPTSSVLLDSIINGVNYVAYEPRCNNNDLFGYPIVWPFNNNEKIPVAYDEKELLFLLKDSATVDNTVINDLISEKFNLSEVISIINSNHKLTGHKLSN